MEVIFESLAETGWGAIIIGVFIIIALFITFMSNTPKT